MLKSARIPSGWEYVTTEKGWDQAWSIAIGFKQQRERLRPGLFVRVMVVPSGHTDTWWVLKRDEEKES